jgi:ribose-phosphate pyrophosphokinase
MDYTFESVPATPAPDLPRTLGLTNGSDITNRLAKTTSLPNGTSAGAMSPVKPINGESYLGANGQGVATPGYTTHDYENMSHVGAFQAKPGYKQWVAQAGTLVANLLTCAGADHGMCSCPRARL